MLKGFYHMKEKIKKILYAVYAIILFILATDIFHIDYLFERDNTFKGTVTFKGKEPRRQVSAVCLNNRNDYYILVSPYEVYEKIKVGDYIIKTKGEKKYTIIRNKDTILYNPEK